MSWTEEQIQRAVAMVMDKAGTDATFRELVLSDVYAAVKEATGKEVPKEFKINVIDGTGYHANIVLPEMRGAADELTETELEAVAGGTKETGRPVYLIDIDRKPILDMKNPFADKD